VSDHTVGHRYLFQLERLRKAGAECTNPRYLELLPQGVKRRLVEDPAYQPEHWVIPACDELGIDPLPVLYGPEYLLHRAVDEEGMLDSATLESVRNMARVADAERWSWEKRHALWHQEAAPLAARSAEVVNPKPITEQQWRRAGLNYDHVIRPTGATMLNAPQPVPVISAAYCCRRCGEDLVAPFCYNCKSTQHVEPMQ